MNRKLPHENLNNPIPHSTRPHRVHNMDMVNTMIGGDVPPQQPSTANQVIAGVKGAVSAIPIIGSLISNAIPNTPYYGHYQGGNPNDIRAYHW